MRKYARIKRYVIPKGEEGLLLGYDPNRFSGRSDTQQILDNNSGSALGRNVGATTTTNTQGNNWGQAANYAQIGAAGLGAMSAAYNNPYGTEQQNQAAAANAGVDTVAGSVLPWYALAMGASNAGKGMIKQDTVVDPKTGKTLTQAKTKEGAALGEVFTPVHTSVIENATKGDWKSVGLDALTGGAYSSLIKPIMNYTSNDKTDFDKAKEAQALAEQERIKAEAEVERKRKYDEQMNYTRAYNTANPMYGREGAGIYKHGGNFAYPNGGTLPTNPITPPTTFDSTAYYNTLNKYQTINPLVVTEANDVKKLVGSQITPQIKSYQEQLNTALRAKYKLNATAPITNQYLSKEEADTALGGKYGDYMNYFNAYDAYRQKTPNLPARSVAGTIDESPEVYGTRHYNLFAPYTSSPTTVREDGGNLALPYSMKAMGGKLIPLASDSTKAIGDTHGQDTNQDGLAGITLQANGNPIAEVEHNEVMDGTKVFSEKRGYAKIAEPMLKRKGKLEEKINSSYTREANGAKRMLGNLQLDIDGLFAVQQATNPDNQPVNNGLPYGQNGLELMEAEDPKLAAYKPYKSSTTNNMSGRYAKTDWARIAQNMIPYLDNAYNTAIINQTPEIPTPVKSVAYDLKPATMKTNINVNPQLNDAERAYQMLQKDLNENTSNPATARGNKLYAFADLLSNKGRVYGAKENAETDLINKSNMNVQDAIYANTKNRQIVDNANIGQTNEFNWANMQRQSDINKMKTGNYANMVDNMTTQTQDRNLEALDQQRIMVDALKYNDASGFAKLIGSPTMDNIMRSTPQSYVQIEKALKDAGQTDALKQFYARYGEPNQ